MEQLTETMKATIKDAAKKLTGAKRRAFQAQVALDYLEGQARQAEAQFGWSRQTVEKGLGELLSGIECVDHFAARGNRKTEAKWPELERDIRALAEPYSQADPKFQSPFAYTRITAQAVRNALLEQQGYQDQGLPTVRTINNMLNRLGYRLRRVQKANPLKKNPPN